MALGQAAGWVLPAFAAVGQVAQMAMTLCQMGCWNLRLRLRRGDMDAGARLNRVTLLRARDVMPRRRMGMRRHGDVFSVWPTCAVRRSGRRSE
jgi:hypothetical protein